MTEDQQLDNMKHEISKKLSSSGEIKITTDQIV